MAACEICKSTGAIEQTKNALISTSCDRCGLFVVTIEGQSTLSNNLVRVLQAPNVNENLRRARLSHIVRRGQRNGRTFHIPLKDVGTWNLDDPLPTPSEQFDNLVLWVGDHQPNYAQSVAIQAPEMAAWMGAPVNIGASEIIGWILQQQSGVGQLIEERVDALRLNLKGWERYYALKQTATDSRTAFMAMQFNNVQLDDVFESCFKPAALAAGFQLHTAVEGQPAGLIDDQMRVAIRRAKFVVSDLTHGNRGAYWEAGFAEGAGKPVIYTCQADVWDGQQTHFDTNHLATIIWRLDDLPDAQRRLTAMIRSTLPSDAKLG